MKLKEILMFSKKFNQKERGVFYILITFFILFLLFRLISGNFYLADSYEYLDTAKRIQNLSFFNSNTSVPFSTKRPFVYPLFLSIFYNLPVLVSIIFQTLIGIFTFFIILKILKKFNFEIKKSYLWLFLFTPSIYIYTQLLVSEWAVMFFVTLIFWVLIQKWSSKNFAYIQILTILLSFTKPVFYPLIYLNFIFFGIYFIVNKKFSFWLFIPIIILQSYMTCNEVKTGYKHFSSIENINLINYNLYYFKSKTESEVKADLWLDSIYNSKFDNKNFKEQNTYLHDIAIKEIKQNFFQYSYYHLYTSLRGVFDPGRFDLMTFFKKEDGSQGLLETLNKNKSIFNLLKNKYSFVFVLLIPVFLTILVKWYYLLKYLFLKKLEFKTYYIIVLLASYILITGPVNASRYMMPFQGVIIIFSVLGMSINNDKKIGSN
ncbi:MAG: hypothetical protein ACI93N_001727 [Flavobacteriaceae bacterium]|jgi:hypothetical protein